MAVRYPKGVCQTCPKPTPTPVPAAKIELRSYHSVPMDESLRLWRHILFGTTTCVSIIEGYAEQGLPGNPIDGVKHLRDRLNTLIQKLETPHAS